MKFFAAIISIIILASLKQADAQSLDGPKNEDPIAYTYGTNHYSCTIEGKLANGKEATIVANTFAVDKSVPVTTHDVITQFYFRARQKHHDLYDQMVVSGGFFANCKVFGTDKEAAAHYGQRVKKAQKNKHKLFFMTGANFDYDTYLLYKKTQKKYKR